MAKCRYCPKEFVSSSTRCTAHLADWEGKKGHDIAVCPDASKEVVESIRTLQEGKCKKQLEKNRAEMAAMDAVSGKTSSGMGSKRGRMLDFYGAEGSVARREADDAICLYFAALGVPENQVDNPLFRNMIRAVAAAGGSYVPPKRKYVGGAGLQRTRKRIEEGLDPVVKKWPEKGVTIASDMMSDRNGRAQANFLCVNEDGAVFMESVDRGMERKTGRYIASLIRPVITKVGPENVVALCMDGASNYAAATREIVKEWPHIEIVPCATHVLDLFMEDIGKMDWAKKLVERAGELITFLRNHHWTRAYLRAGELHGEKVLQALRPAGTRFGTQYLAVSRLCELRPHLCSMVSHDVFKDWAAAAGAKVKEAADKFEKYVLDSACPANQKEGIFLRDRECTKVMKEFLERAHDFLVKYKRGGAGGFKELQKGMLAYINGDESFGTKSAVEAREEIRAGKGDLLSWWQWHGCDYPELADIARRTLAQPVSASSCEWNWAKWEGVHTARRNRLGSEKCRNLVYVAHNWLVVYNAHKRPEMEGAGIIEGNKPDPPVPEGYILEEEVDEEEEEEDKLLADEYVAKTPDASGAT
ncbi:unnamed protein product [Closterium sp. NIES-65]|nr:unnamed protein product [Closterium sp. NIES-65]